MTKVQNQINIELLESIPPNQLKIIELYNKIDSGLLNTQPGYQRKLVWKKQHKYAFIDTILRNFPFPEIYIASADMDVENMRSQEVVVDGQQRLNAIVNYIKSDGDFKAQNKVPRFDGLKQEQKKTFLNYKVAVRDLKDIDEILIKEIFKRINSTEYSLNAVELSNAQFGDGEIAVFCKQLVEPVEKFSVSEDQTDIVISPEIRTKVRVFFERYKVFTENDKKRMYDFQYLMLFTATILEGHYFGRSAKVDEYLENFNAEFPNHQLVIDSLSRSIEIMGKLDFSAKSYWYNKANAFTLLVEFSKVLIDNIDIPKLEQRLLDLEEKMEQFYSAETEDDLLGISEDEKKYFQDARHGSHEKAAREHRGKVIQALLEATKTDREHKARILEIGSSEITVENHARFIPTETGLIKSILDATSTVRDFLRDKGIHNFYDQELSSDHKVLIDFSYQNGQVIKNGLSLYRTHRGDYRMWFKGLREFADPEDEIAIVLIDGGLVLINLTKR